MPFNDPSQTDLAWRGYSSWAMLPSFAICIVLSLVLLTGSWFFEDFRFIGQEMGSFIFFLATLAIWLGQLLRWLYRGATYIYRLTPAYFYLDLGFLYNPEPPVDLAKITAVDWGSDALCRFFGVGWVAMHVEGRPSVRLKGILRPAAFAEEIEAASKKRKAGKHLTMENG